MKSRVQNSRTVEGLFNKYSELYKNPINKKIQWICAPLIIFSFLGLVWSIPFPHLNFLGKYNGFVNWASFVIGFTVYYYLRLSPVLSYAMLLLIFAFSAIIVWLEKMNIQNNWPPLAVVSLSILFTSWTGHFIGEKIEEKKFSILADVKFLLNCAVWLFLLVFKKVGLKY